MPRYMVYMVTTASAAIEVEAVSADDAEDRAYEVGFPSPCHQEEFELAGDWEIDEVVKLED